MSIFQAPGLELMQDLLQSHPCRSLQIETLATLLHPNAAIARNIVVYGPEASGKSAIVEGVVSRISQASDDEWMFKCAIVKSVQCITLRHMFERSLALIQEALGIQEKVPRCDNLAQFTSELSQILGMWAAEGTDVRPTRRHFALVFDGIQGQREATGTLAAGLARLAEIVPCLVCVFIAPVPPPSFLRTTSVLNVHFPNYAKHEFVKILALSTPPSIADLSDQETHDLWTRFCGTVHDSLAKAAIRTLPLLRSSCERLWPLFVAPIELGTHDAKEFSKLLIAARMHFQDEALINPSLVSAQPILAKPEILPFTEVSTGDSAASFSSGFATTTPNSDSMPYKKDLAVLLPTMPRLILIAAYLASHNPVRHDITVFSTFHHGKKKKRGGLASTLPQRAPRSKHRKIARKLLGAHSFVMERMMAILAAVRSEWAAAVGLPVKQTTGIDGDIGLAMATLTSLRLLVRVGAGSDLLDRGSRWRITVTWDDVRSIGRSVGLEIEDWLVE
ncbi:hypothetical protein Cpir12675_000728 [Ceratocystis pirilliformis]|uniref:Origin recognition complex subunit 5 n=1 Tax=Ceratocystis pirilliformis TaxID=259994 RepID=A0ABR3ZKV7_9PEZI